MKKLAIALTVASALWIPLRGAEKPRVSAGSGTLIIGSYPKQFWIIDEATEKVVGTIPFQSGIPRRTNSRATAMRACLIAALP